jgi:hypothetical protein
MLGSLSAWLAWPVSVVKVSARIASIARGQRL